jgi:hypothetical protein
VQILCYENIIPTGAQVKAKKKEQSNFSIIIPEAK